MHMWMKYKTDFKKYWKSEVDKYKSISAVFLFFDDKEDAKKTNNNVVKGCLIHVYEDINNLPPFPS